MATPDLGGKPEAMGTSDRAAVELPPRYYRDNFLTLCRTAEQQYGDLLEAVERDWLEGFYAQPVTAQCLYVRLVSRVGPWFRASKLDYPEIGPLQAPLAQLLESGYVFRAEALDVVDLGRLFTRRELRRRFPQALTPAGTDKSSDLELIAGWAEGAGVDDAALLQLACGDDSEIIVAPTGLDVVELLQLLFFGNRHQSLTDFVLSDLGIATYYPYNLDRAHRLFPDRAAVDDYLACARLAERYVELREAGDDAGIAELGRLLTSCPVAHPASQRRWWRLFNRVARQLERTGELELARALYQRSALHPARERRARVFEALENWPAAIDLCREIIEAPWGEEEREAALRILPRVQRRAGISPESRPRDRFPRLDLDLPNTGEPVEQAAAAALEAAGEWATVHYVENNLVNGLFGLAFWEEIFSPVEGAFHHAFQAVPADMYDSSFQDRRREALEARFARLQRADLARELSRAYRRYEGYQCRWVNWRALPLELVEAALARLPRAHLLAMWRRQLFDPAENRRGFPDLLALGEGPGAYCMIEVKGPGDALQDSQKRWLRFFGERGIPAQVAWVRWRDD